MSYEYLSNYNAQLMLQDDKSGKTSSSSAGKIGKGKYITMFFSYGYKGINAYGRSGKLKSLYRMFPRISFLIPSQKLSKKSLAIKKNQKPSKPEKYSFFSYRFTFKPFQGYPRA